MRLSEHATHEQLYKDELLNDYERRRTLRVWTGRCQRLIMEMSASSARSTRGRARWTTTERLRDSMSGLKRRSLTDVGSEVADGESQRHATTGSERRAFQP